MRLKNAFTILTFMLIAASIGFADRLLGQQYSTTPVNRMFLDARNPAVPAAYRRSEIKRMIRDAKTSADFEHLANYFDYRAMEFEQKSQEELKELERLRALPYHAKSYPTQIDSTRQLLAHYKDQALKCSARAATYRKRAKMSSDTKESTVAPTQ
jgi:hypothetical protein